MVSISQCRVQKTTIYLSVCSRRESVLSTSSQNKREPARNSSDTSLPTSQLYSPNSSLPTSFYLHYALFKESPCRCCSKHKSALTQPHVIVITHPAQVPVQRPILLFTLWPLIQYLISGKIHWFDEGYRTKLVLFLSLFLMNFKAFKKIQLVRSIFALGRCWLWIKSKKDPCTYFWVPVKQINAHPNITTVVS